MGGRPPTGHRAEILHFFLDCMGAMMERRHELAAFREVRARQQADYDAELKANPKARPSVVVWPNLSDQHLDEYRRAARDRMAAEYDPSKATANRVRIAAVLRGRVSKLLSLASGAGETRDAIAAHKAVADVVMSEAKLTGLIVDRVEGVHTHGIGDVDGPAKDRLAAFVASVTGLDRPTGGPAAEPG